MPDWQLSPGLGLNPPIPNSWRSEPPVFAEAVEDAVGERAVAPLDVLAGAAGRSDRVTGGAAPLVEDRTEPVGLRLGRARSSPSPPRRWQRSFPAGRRRATARRSRSRCLRRSNRRPNSRPRRSATAAPRDTRLTHRICRVITNLLCGLAPEVWGHGGGRTVSTASRQKNIRVARFPRRAIAATRTRPHRSRPREIQPAIVNRRAWL